METTDATLTKTDLITTILGVLVIVWSLSLYTYCLVVAPIDFSLYNCGAFLIFGTYLIWFKGDRARAFLSRITKKLTPDKS